MDQFLNNAEKSGISYPQDFYISKLQFITPSGPIDFERLLIEFSYYEDIFSFVSSGHLSVVDGQGFIESLQLSGNEFLEIEYSKSKNGPSNKNTFRVYKIGDRVPGGNPNTSFYTLYFCSEELLLSEQNKITKTYPGTKISDIVKNILDEELKILPKNIYKIEETTGLYDFSIPRLKPFEAISWLSTYARPEAGGTTGGADMLFFETKDGYNFRSIKSMLSAPPMATYKYQLNNLESADLTEKIFTVLDYEFVKTQDMLENISSGMVANKLISIDPFKKSYNTTNFNINSKETNTGSLKNRLGQNQNESYDSVVKVVTTNAGQRDVPYIKEVEGSVAQDIFIETYVPNRTSQINLANYITVKMTVPGNPILTVGRTMNFNLLSQRNSSNNTQKDLDAFYSGKYLITAARHVISAEGKYITVLEIVKEKTEKRYANIGGNSGSWKSVVKE